MHHKTALVHLLLMLFNNYQRNRAIKTKAMIRFFLEEEVEGKDRKQPITNMRMLDCFLHKATRGARDAHIMHLFAICNLNEFHRPTTFFTMWEVIKTNCLG